MTDAEMDKVTVGQGFGCDHAKHHTLGSGSLDAFLAPLADKLAGGEPSGDCLATVTTESSQWHFRLADFFPPGWPSGIEAALQLQVNVTQGGQDGRDYCPRPQDCLQTSC